MQIKKITITQFGKWRNTTMEWHDGVNVIYASNEWGKTTIVAFLKLMLYGYQGRGASIRENERKRYIPWGEKTMGGELTIEQEGVPYVITRTFGKTKSGDSISVVNGLTGKTVPDLCIEAPGEALLGVGVEGFEKTLLIRQLATSFEAGKDDEILNKLVNLVQSGEEGNSYRSGLLALEAAIKELNGTRPKGKIPLLQERKNQLYQQQYEAKQQQVAKEQLEQQLARLHQREETLKGQQVSHEPLTQAKELHAKVQQQLAEHTGQQQAAQSKGKRALFAGLVVCAVLAIALFFWHPLAAILPVAGGIAWMLLSRRRKRTPEKYRPPLLEQLLALLHVADLEEVPAAINHLERQIEAQKKQQVDELVALSRQIGEMQQRLESALPRSVATIEEELSHVDSQMAIYQQGVEDLTQAKQALVAAFEQLQQQFSVPLSEKTAQVLSLLTEGKYTQVLVDDNYQMKVRQGAEGNLVEMEYLSNGAYDQIYFSLRMALADLLLPGAPLVLDDAFLQYDDQRLRAAMAYLHSTNRQVLLFTCHKRENEMI